MLPQGNFTCPLSSISRNPTRRSSVVVDLDSERGDKLLAWRNHAQTLTRAKCVCGRGHRFNGDELLILGSKDLGKGETAFEFDGDGVAVTGDREPGRLTRKGKAIVVAGVTKPRSDGRLRSFLASGNPLHIERQLAQGRSVQRPLCPRDFREAEIGMETETDRNR